MTVAGVCLNHLRLQTMFGTGHIGAPSQQIMFDARCSLPMQQIVGLVTPSCFLTLRIRNDLMDRGIIQKVIDAARLH